MIEECVFMVERSQAAGWLPSLYEPIKKAGQKIANWFAPRADASVTPEAYEITMELPGVSAEDIDVAVQDGNIVVTREKRFEQEETDKNYFFSEREYGAFQRVFDIPADGEQDAIDAEFRNGVLLVRIPKARADTSAPRKIDVRSEQA
jgi:HSP20 family protein